MTLSRTYRLWTTCAAVLLILLGLAACSMRDIGYKYDPNKATPDFTRLPIYDGAKNIVRQGKPGVDETVRFEENVAPEVVLEYYRNTLAKDGWEPRGVGTPPINTLYLLWMNGRQNPAYRLDVKVNSQDGRTSAVELLILRELIE
jgi:hypothetical protein